MIKLGTNFWAKFLWTCARESVISTVRTERVLNFVSYCAHKFIIKTLQTEETQKLWGLCQHANCKKEKIAIRILKQSYSEQFTVWLTFLVLKFRQANKTRNYKRKAAAIYVTREPFQVTLYTDTWARGKIVLVCVLCIRFRHRNIHLWLSESYGNRAVWYVGVWGHAVGEGTRV